MRKGGGGDADLFWGGGDAAKRKRSTNRGFCPGGKKGGPVAKALRGNWTSHPPAKRGRGGKKRVFLLVFEKGKGGDGAYTWESPARKRKRRLSVAGKKKRKKTFLTWPFRRGSVFPSKRGGDGSEASIFYGRSRKGGRDCFL